MNSNFKANFRKIHRKSAPVIFLPLLLSALTGLSYRIGRNWFGLSHDFGNFMLTLHEGRFLGSPLVPVYVLLVGLGLIGMVVTGITMLLPWKKSSTSKPIKLNPRRLHRYLAPIFFLPLLVSASTGITYRLGQAWFGLSSDHANLVLSIHQGSYLGSWQVVYILLIGLGLLGLLVTGVKMTGIFRTRR